MRTKLRKSIYPRNCSISFQFLTLKIDPSIFYPKLSTKSVACLTFHAFKVSYLCKIWTSQNKLKLFMTHFYNFLLCITHLHLTWIVTLRFWSWSLNINAAQLKFDFSYHAVQAVLVIRRGYVLGKYREYQNRGQQGSTVFLPKSSLFGCLFAPICMKNRW